MDTYLVVPLTVAYSTCNGVQGKEQCASHAPSSIALLKLARKRREVATRASIHCCSGATTVMPYSGYKDAALAQL